MKKRIEFLAVCRWLLLVNFGVMALVAASAPWEDLIFFTDLIGSFESIFLLWVIFSIPGVAIIFAAILLKCLWNAVCGVHLLYRNLRNQFAYFR